MSEYLKVIEDYISRENSDYALMIDGKWGIGKTYFYRETVVPYLLKKGKKPIYISLNGINSVEEISKQIYIETTLYQNEIVKKFGESKVAKYGKQIFKIAHFSAVSVGLLDGSDIKPISCEELLSIGSDITICFDDLERCDLDIVQILGYINNLVEHMQVKTIVICNEDEIKDIKKENNIELKMITAILSTKQEIDKEAINKVVNELFANVKQYDLIKEKVIGKTLNYEPELSTIIDQIVSEYNKKGKSNIYYDFLRVNIVDVIEVFMKSEKSNLRILKHSISDFERIFNIINENLRESDYKSVLIKQYFISALISGTEIRLGSLTKDFLCNHESTELKTSLLSFYKNKD
ncbi:P-loop NTPase fold protein, partial [Bacillus sp. JJ664]